jgi:hypothetical protein
MCFILKEEEEETIDTVQSIECFQEAQANIRDVVEVLDAEIEAVQKMSVEASLRNEEVAFTTNFHLLLIVWFNICECL